MLAHLPEFERRGGILVRVDDPEQFVFPQSEWDRMERIRKEVEDSIARQEQEVQGATEAELQVPKPETKGEVEHIRLFPQPHGVRLNRFGSFEPFSDN